MNIVRKQEQVDLLTKLGAKFVVNSSSESFKKGLYKAIDATGATLAFTRRVSIRMALWITSRCTFF